MNVHHLELFYHVARAGGIVAACRSMPYGIQQPAVSAQVAKLEDDLGTRLFERRPFRLTPAGQTLFDFVSPFFGRLDEIESLVRGERRSTVRLCGLTEVMREHVPAILAEMRKREPALKVTLQEIDQRGAEKRIAEGDADLAITVLESRLPPGFRSRVLAELPMALVLPASEKTRTAAALLRSGAAGQVPLISLPPHELLPRLFQKELARRGLVWRTSMETSSQDLVTIYVRSGLGAGLGVRTPDLARDPTIRLLPLTGFPALPIGAFWRGKLEGPAGTLVEALAQRSAAILKS
ncbi:MAG: LysR family transcriptional regulator [Terrimicrobiaceae bacterium]|nr:LysR family transcriptional regulator [Terrimicrobiaceae bacterium]